MNGDVLQTQWHILNGVQQDSGYVVHELSNGNNMNGFVEDYLNCYIAWN